jgi:uncharacterized protein (TIGR02266 family)
LGSPRRLRVKFKGHTLQDFARRYLTDISSTGMFVRTAEPLPVGTKLHFDFRLEDDSPLLSGEAVVLWKAEESPELHLPSGMELRFESFEAASDERFHWLQMERRGVTVGREMPLSISTSSSPESNSSPGKGSNPKGHKADTSPGRPESLIEDTPGVAPSDEQLIDRADEALSGLPTAPYMRLADDAHPPTMEPVVAEESPPTAALVPAPWNGITAPHYQQVLPAQDHSAEEVHPLTRAIALRPKDTLPPGDSDPGKLFHRVANTVDSFLDLGPLVPQKTVMVGMRKSARFSWQAIVAVSLLAAVVGGIVVYFALGPTAPPENRATDGVQPRLVRISADPDGSEVFVDSIRVGSTPLEMDFKNDAQININHFGFVPELVALTAGDPRWTVQGQRLVLDLKVRLRTIKEAQSAIQHAPPKDVPAAQPQPIQPVAEGVPAVKARVNMIRPPQEVSHTGVSRSKVQPAPRFATDRETSNTATATERLEELAPIQEQPSAEKPASSGTEEQKIRMPPWAEKKDSVEKKPPESKEKKAERLKKPSWMDKAPAGPPPKAPEKKLEKPTEKPTEQLKKPSWMNQ